jgi:hypothetical protein
MLRIKWIYKTILLVTLCLISVSPCKALYVQDDEINEMYTDGAFIVYDISTQFPAIGTFDNGLGDATCCWKADTSGGGMIIQYTAETEGWLGLRCEAGQSASVEYGPLYLSLAADSAAKPAFDWDQLGGAFHFRGNPAYGSKVAGKLQLEFYDAAGRECHPLIAVDMSSTAINGNCPQMGLNQDGTPDNFAWVSFAFQFTLPHSSWYQISKVKISYSAPSGELVPTTEIQMDQIYLVPWWLKPY